MNTAIIDYGSGNLRSVAKALEHVSSHGTVTVTSDPKVLAQASHIILPGVGAFGDCIHGLNAISGMREALEEQVRQKKKPFLGICVGMQMLLEKGYEHGEHTGLGWIEGEVIRLNPADASLKIPHMGWNDLRFKISHPLLANIAQNAHAYFVHSYHAVCKNASDVIAETDYGSAVTAIVAKENIMGMQFHPEKSQETGLQLLKNFLNM